VIVVRLAAAVEVGDLQQSVLRPEGPLPQDTPLPDSALHVGAFDEGHPDVALGAASLLPAPWPGPGVLARPTWQLRSMAVAAGLRGTGVGHRVLRHAVATAHAHGAASLWAAARVEAVGFYARSGWEVVGPDWVKPGVGPHRYVTLVLPAHPEGPP
jgi:GNAT superfamily N-acetyltransferase